MIQSKNNFSALIGYRYTDLDRIALAIKSDNSSRYYYSYEKKKANGKVRTIAPSCSELKDIQKRLNSRIFKHIQFPFYITGSIKKRSSVINAKIHAGNTYHLQTDLVGFFDFVNYREVYKSLISIGFSADIARITTQLTTYKGHLPQGAPTSSFLANLVGLSIDNVLLKYCSEKELLYSRYVDDITFSAKHTFKEDVLLLLSKITELGYLYSHKKTFYKLGPVDITGTQANSKGLQGTKEQLEKLCSPLINNTSKEGILGHHRYIESINRNFNLPKYKEAFANLEYPEALYPYMNEKL